MWAIDTDRRKSPKSELHYQQNILASTQPYETMIQEVTIADHTFFEFYASNYVYNYLCVFEVPVITCSSSFFFCLLYESIFLFNSRALC